MKLTTRRRGATISLLSALFLSVPLVSVPLAAWAEEDPSLDQIIDADQPVVTGPAVLSSGHVDMGPRFIEGEWQFMIHDDAALADAGGQSVWRYPTETVFHILDASQLTIPDDPAYSFIDAEAGDAVWLSPQTQHPEVVWLGWNTQDPEVMGLIDRGVTLTFAGMEGPGELSVFLQSGSFGEPQVLWDSQRQEDQPIWVDVNTHTHANWVFTMPGVYLVEVIASAELIDGSSVTDTQVLRIAVGSSVDPTEALSATWGGSSSGSDAQELTATVPEQTSDPLVPVLGALIGVVAAALVVGFIVVVVRSNRARRLAFDAPATEKEPND